MKYILFIALLFAFAGNSLAQKNKKQEALNLKNVVIIGQLDNIADRYSLEINMTDLINANGIKTKPSLNVVKRGSDAIILASDSLQALLKEQGFDTYLIVSVRGYDRRFKLAENQPNFKEALGIGGIYELYRMDIVSITFEFKFYRGGEFVFGDSVRCGNISDRETVLKRLKKKLRKRIPKKWK